MSNAISVYKEIISQYSDIVYDTWEVASAHQTLPLPVVAAPRVRVRIRLQLEIASPISGNHCGWVPSLSLDSLYALTLCSIKIVLTEGLHGASHSSLWASLRGQLDSTLNPS
jgi:hypothetical protein